MNLKFIIPLMLCWVWTAFGQATRWITPTNATASGYTVWAGSWYTGPAAHAIDGTNITSWTLQRMGYLDLDLGTTNLIRGVEVNLGGNVTSGNTINVYVDGVRVLTNQQFIASVNTRYFQAVQGRRIRYETVALPHNELGQVATWSEVAEFRVFVETVPPQQPALAIRRAIEIRWLTEPGVIYQPQISNNTETWQDFGVPVTGDGTEQHVIYVAEGAERAFFRVRAR